MTTQQSVKPRILACYRPGWPFWFIAIIFIGMAAIGAYVQMPIGFSVLCMMMALSFSLLITIVDADCDGMTVWNWRGRRRILWEDIQDYYLHPPYKGNTSGTIKTAAGNVRISEANSGFTEMAQCITEHTPHLPTREWGLLGCRKDDPAAITFRYSWISDGVLGTFFAGFTVLFAYWSLSKSVSNWHLFATYAGIGWAVGFILITLHMPIFMGLTSWACWYGFKDARLRRNHCLTVTNEYLQFEDGSKLLAVPWQEITEWHAVPVKRGALMGILYAICTPHGNIEITSRIGSQSNANSFRVLYKILEQRIGSIKQNEPDDTMISNSANRWTNIARDGASTVYHYRTRVNRAFLLFACAYPLMPVLGRIAQISAGIPMKPMPEFVPLMIVAAIAFIYFQWRYRTAAVITDGNGIRTCTVFGETRIAWMNVTSYEKGSYVAVVRGEGKTLRFWLTISDASKLMETIQEKSINSWNKWETNERYG